MTTSSSPPRILVILGSTREGRAGERYARWFMDIAEARKDLRAEFVDLRDWPLPFYDVPGSPLTGVRAPEAQEWSALIAGASGYVIVTPEYNHGYPGVLKNAMDHLFQEWQRKPIGFVSYGGPAGGTRAVQQLRQVAIELSMVPVRASVAFSMGALQWNEAAELRNPDFYLPRATALLDELGWYARVLGDARAPEPV